MVAMCLRTVLRSLLIGLPLAFANSACTEKPGRPELRPGDLLFQDLDCGELCEAIEAVTEGADGKDFSHVGIAVRTPEGMRIVEAIGTVVHESTWDEFVERSSKVFVGRTNDDRLAERASQAASQLLGTPYDDAFLPGSEKLYCSELVEIAYGRANGGAAFFATPDMTFKDPRTQAYFPAWVAYYEKLGVPIPEGLPGCNPGQLSREPAVRVVWRGF